MATTRKVTVFNMGDNAQKTVYSTANTWGELKAAHPEIARMVANDMKVVIKETRTTIEVDTAILPETDIILYLSPGKVKAGDRDLLEEEMKKDAAVVELAIKEDLEELLKEVEAIVE